jgi:hypothetical protein
MENLLARHREGSAETGTVSLVQPRPRARFESDLGPTAGAGNAFASSYSFEQDFLSPLPENQSDPDATRAVPVTEPSAVGTDRQLFGKQELQNDRDHMTEQAAPVQSSPVLPKLEKKVQEPEVPTGMSKTWQSKFQHQLSEPAGKIIFQSPFAASYGLNQKTDTSLQPSILPRLNAEPHTHHVPAKNQPFDPKTNAILSAITPQNPIQQEVSPVTKPAIEQQLKTVQQRLTAQQTPKNESAAILSPVQVAPDRDSRSIFKNTDRQREFEGIRPALAQTPELPRGKRQITVSTFDQRIQEILYRLHALQKDAGKPEPVQSEQQEVRLAAREITRPISSEILTGEEKLGQPLSAMALKKQARPGKPPVSSNEIFAPTGRRKAKNKAEQQQDGRSIASESGQAALLQPPAWLASVQADLQNRRQQSSPQSGSEPIINITIGRIEIRAVQSKSATMPKSSQKPSGIMSLDDYLKQRENRGRI